MKAPQTLRELVEVAVERHDGACVRQLGFKAQDRGFKVAHTTLNAIRASSYKSTPKQDTLRAIAWMAGVDEAVAFVAAGQTVPGPPLADDLPPGSDNLSAKSRKVLIDVARVLVDQEAEIDDKYLSTDRIRQLIVRDDGRDAGPGQKITVEDLLNAARPKIVNTIAQAVGDEYFAEDEFHSIYYSSTHDPDRVSKRVRGALRAALASDILDGRDTWAEAVVKSLLKEIKLRAVDHEDQVEAQEERNRQTVGPDIFDVLEAAGDPAVEDGPVPGQKLWPADKYDLAAHEGMPMMRDQSDSVANAASEENQDHRQP